MSKSGDPLGQPRRCAPSSVGHELEDQEILARASGAGGGRKDDAGKLRIELFPPEALFAISDVLTAGARKYEDRNWEKGMRWSRPFGALMRHMWAWWGGKGPTSRNFLFGDTDDETGRSHLWHAGCCMVFLITYEERGVGGDDRHRGGGL